MANLPCVEFIKIVVNDAFTRDPRICCPGLEALSKASGIVNIFLGNEEQDSRNLFLINAWESLKHHESFMEDTENYAPVREGLPSMMKSLAYLFHVYFTTEPYKALTAPLTEVVVLTLKDGVSNEKFVPVLSKLVSAMNTIPEALGACGGATWGTVVENDRQYVVLGGWKDLKSWENVPNLPGSTELLAELHEHAELEVRHAQLSKCTGHTMCGSDGKV